ncbi:MAG: menaquinone reductase multiheme cytochrome c subunit QrcA [Thermodesulfobacteriota bacterium]|nr:menaquinone reductase multiheme cytochrome c subunit QrcA [Thermodesulfobacteriota bacterium]
MKKSDSSDKLIETGLFLLAGLIPSLIIGWIIFPMVLYSSQPQPINFNHAIHLDEEIVEGIEGDTESERCLYCHEFRNDGTFAGIPKLDKCSECHDDPESPLGETQAEAEFLERYVADGNEIAWLSYYKQPDCVYFSHIAHVKMGEIECGTCHGNHENSEKLPVYKENRLTGYSIAIWGENIAGYKTNTWDRMKMDDCAECHTKMGHEENNACFVCHK